MEWDAKVKMVELGNAGSTSVEFHSCVKKNIDSFDAQAWDMFVQLISLEKEEFEKNRTFLNSILGEMEQALEKVAFNIHTTVRFSILLEQLKSN